MTEAVVFDLDGVLLDSEQVWDEVREQLVKERGGRWHEGAQTEMMGMSSIEEELSLARAAHTHAGESLGSMRTKLLIAANALLTAEWEPRGGWSQIEVER